MPFIVKNTTFPGPLDLLSPHSCRGCGRLGEPICECCKNNIFSQKSHRKLPQIYAVGDRDGLLGDIIHDYKYYSIRSLARPLAELLDLALPKNLPANSVIIPLPTATHHIRERGFDHTLKIAKNLSKIRHIPVKQILLRNKNTVQVGSDRKTRLAQATSAYILNPKIKIDQDTTYILLDDVLTTGASIMAGKRLLETAGAKNVRIAILALSRR